MRKPYYKKNKEKGWFCSTHNREATHLLVRENMEDKPCCDPRQSGIAAPCQIYYRTKEARKKE